MSLLLTNLSMIPKSAFARLFCDMSGREFIGHLLSITAMTGFFVNYEYYMFKHDTKNGIWRFDLNKNSREVDHMYLRSAVYGALTWLGAALTLSNYPDFTMRDTIFAYTGFACVTILLDLGWYVVTERVQLV